MPGIPVDITIAGRTPATIKGNFPPLIDTAEAARGGFRAGDDSGDPPVSTSNWSSHSQTSRAPAPLLRFTDLISGPATGLGDSLGSGVIVTIWAQGVGDTQGTGKVYFTDSASVKREAAHVYYWKRADGVLPSGPARLWYSHLMQEIAFSIPAGSADGAGTITVETGGQTSNVMPFTVRAGSIYHVKSTGNNADSGTFSTPFADPDYALNNVSNSATIYIHDVNVGSTESPSGRGLFWSKNSSNDGTKESHSGTVAYPGYQPSITAQMGAAGGSHVGWLLSKLLFFSSNQIGISDNDQPSGTYITTSPRDTYCVKTTQWGRIIGNRMTDIPDACASQMQGAIMATPGFGAEGFKNIGNEIHEYGCYGSSKFHHTTYFTIRDDTSPQIECWESAFCFLWGNHAKNGLHNYDQPDATSGGLTTNMLIHHNVIAAQGGSGISVGSNTGWDIEVLMDNNILIDVGRAAAWDGLDVDTSDGARNSAINILDQEPDGFPSTVRIRNNLIYKFKNDGQNNEGDGALVFSGNDDTVDVRWDNNIAVSDRDITFIGYNRDAENKLNNITGGNSVWHYNGSNPSNAIPPSFDSNAISVDTGITLDGAIVTISSTSVAKAASNASVPDSAYDIYGVPRPATYTIGPVEAS